MKRILFYILFLFPLLVGAQSRYAIMKVPYCWTTDAMVDSSINRVILVTTQTSVPTTLYFSNVDGDTVNVSGGSLTFGYCDCCSGGNTGNVVTAINGLTNISPDSIKLGGFLIESTQIDAAGNDLDFLNIDTSMYLGDFLAFVGNERLKLNSVFFPRNDGFDGQALRYDASGDSLQWYTPSASVNIYNSDGAQTDQIRTDTLAGKTLVFDGQTGTGDSSTMIRMLADFSSDDAKTTFLSMETGAAGTPTDSLIFYDYDTSFKIESSSNLNIIADNFLQLDTDSMQFSINGNYGNGPGTYFIDQRVAPRGIEYQSLSYIPTLSDSSLVPKFYVDSLNNASNGVFSSENSGTTIVPQQMYVKTLDEVNDPQLYFGYFPSFPDINYQTEETNGFYISPFYWGSNGLVKGDGTGNYSDISNFTTGFYSLGQNNSSGFISSTNKGRVAYSNGVTSLLNQDSVTSNPIFNTVKQYTYNNSVGGVYTIGTVVKIQDMNQSKDYYLGFGKSKESTYVRFPNDQDNYTWEGANYGFVIQSRSTTADTFNFFRIDLESTTANAASFYNRKYYLPNSQPSIQSGKISIWTNEGTGTTTDPKMRQLTAGSGISITTPTDSTLVISSGIVNDVFYGQTSTTNETYTTARPIEHWASVFSTGCGSCVTLQGDTAFVFNQTGVFDVEFNLILYSLSATSVFTIEEGNVTGTISSFGLDWDGHTVVNDGQEYTVKYTLNVTAAPASFTLDIGGDGTGTTVRTGSRVSIKKLY